MQIKRRGSLRLTSKLGMAAYNYNRDMRVRNSQSSLMIYQVQIRLGLCETVFPGIEQNHQATNQKTTLPAEQGLEQVIHLHCPIYLLFSVYVETNGLKFANPCSTAQPHPEVPSLSLFQSIKLLLKEDSCNLKKNKKQSIWS